MTMNDIEWPFNRVTTNAYEDTALLNVLLLLLLIIIPRCV